MKPYALFFKNKHTEEFDIITNLINSKQGDVITVTKRNGEETSVTVHKVQRQFLSRFGPMKGQNVCQCSVERAKTTAPAIQPVFLSVESVELLTAYRDSADDLSAGDAYRLLDRLVQDLPDKL